MNMNYCIPSKNLEDFNKVWRHLGFSENLREEVRRINGDIGETKDTFKIYLDVPGIRQDDIKIEFSNDELTVLAERKIEKVEGEDIHLRERYAGKFARTFQVNEAIKEDEIQADLKDGVLTVTLPKAEVKKPKTISIKVS